jgi:hypothetical protein
VEFLKYVSGWRDLWIYTLEVTHLWEKKMKLNNTNEVANKFEY